MVYARVRLRSAVFATALLIAGCWSLATFAQPRSFKDQDLSNRNFAGQVLNGADFSGATLQRADFTQASLKGANFAEADLRNAIFNRADLTGADFRKVIGPFHGSEANFAGANFEGVDLKGYLHQKTNFRGANLRNTSGWSCADCNFRQADVRGANFSGLSQSMSPNSFNGAIYDNDTAWPRWMGAAPPDAQRAP